MHDPPAIYIDTNVFIAAYEAVGARSDHAWWLLEAVETGLFHAVTSELTLAEVLVRPYRDGDAQLCKIYDDIMRSVPQLAVTPISRDILTHSARLRAGRSGLKLPDAIHCATALKAGCRALVTDDRRMPQGFDIAIVPFGAGTLATLRGLVAP